MIDVEKTITLRTDLPGLFIVHEPKRGKRAACARTRRGRQAWPLTTEQAGRLAESDDEH